MDLHIGIATSVLETVDIALRNVGLMAGITVRQVMLHDRKSVGV